MSMDEHTEACLRAMLEKKQMQVLHIGGGWQDEGTDTVLTLLGNEHYRANVRIKPESMCELAGVQYPMPLDKEPKDGEVVWKAAANGWPESCEWGAGMDIDNSLYHASQIAAEAHSQAILAVNAQAVKAAKEQA